MGKGVPKLKTISQIFKEKGGYEVLGTLKDLKWLDGNTMDLMMILKLRRNMEDFLTRMIN